MSLLFTFAYSLLNYSDTCRTDDEEHTGHNHHVALCAAYKREDHAAECCRYDLRDAYRAVEQTEVGTMWLPLRALVTMVNGMASIAAQAHPIRR